jgi:ribosomal protein S18 acetylase RimI-like enzyme
LNEVVSTYRGLGVGTRIITDLIAEAKDNGACVVLSVLKVNPAKRLYDRLGLCVISETSQAYEMRIGAS